MKRMLVTGANGLLGTKLVSRARGAYTITATDLQASLRAGLPDVTYIQADISAPEQVETLHRHDYDVIIHGAAYTNVDGCELNPGDARAVNAHGTEYLARLSARCGSTMVYVSTDYVFDGTDGPNTEQDAPNPQSVYGRTKYEGEQLAAAVLDNLIIARTAVLFGYAPDIPSNFLTWLIGELRGGRSVNIVTDQYNTPTLADDLAEACIRLYEKGFSGLYHTAGSQWLNRYDFACICADVFGFDKALICKTTTDKLGQKAARPMIGGLKSGKAEQDVGMRFSGSRDAILRVKEQMEKSTG